VSGDRLDTALGAPAPRGRRFRRLCPPVRREIGPALAKVAENPGFMPAFAVASSPRQCAHFSLGDWTIASGHG